MRITSKRRQRAATPLVKSVELALAVPTVIASRTARMLAAGATPSAKDRREFARMSEEKVEAFSESLVAMAIRGQRMQGEWWLAFARAWWAPWGLGNASGWFGPRTRNALAKRASSASLDVLARGLAPIHRTATANARRLRRGG